MISPVEEIYSPQSKTPHNAKDNVPKQFAHVETKTLCSKCLRGGAIALMIVVIAIVVTVTLHGDLSKSFLLNAKSFLQKCKNLFHIYKDNLPKGQESLL